MSNLPSLKKRRGVARASITRLATRLKDLENDATGSTTLDLARGMTRKLDALDSEFRNHHHNIVDFIDNEEALQREQSTLDEHDDCVAELAARMQQLISVCTSSSDSSPRKIASRRLSRLQKNLSSISTEIATLSGRPDDSCLLLQYEDQLTEIATLSGSLTAYAPRRRFSLEHSVSPSPQHQFSSERSVSSSP